MSAGGCPRLVSLSRTCNRVACWGRLSWPTALAQVLGPSLTEVVAVIVADRARAGPGPSLTGLAVAAVVIFKIIHEGAEFSSIMWPLAGMIALILVRSGLQYLQEVISHHTASVVKVALRERLYQHCLALGPGYFDQSRTGDVLMSLAEGVERLEAFFGRYLPQIVVAALAPVLIFAFMAIIDFRTGLVFLAFALLTLVLPNIFHRWTRTSSMARRDEHVSSRSRRRRTRVCYDFYADGSDGRKARPLFFPSVRFFLSV